MAGAGVLDFVAGWFVKAGQYISSTPGWFGGIAAKANQGRKNFEDMKFGQVWAWVICLPITMRQISNSAAQCAAALCRPTAPLRASRWTCCGRGCWPKAFTSALPTAPSSGPTDAPGKAAVHCVIVGFGVDAVKAPRFFDYDDIQGSVHELVVNNINPYFVDSAAV